METQKIYEFKVSELIDTKDKAKELEKVLGLYQRKGNLDDLKKANALAKEMARVLDKAMSDSAPAGEIETAPIEPQPATASAADSASTDTLDWTVKPLAPRDIMMLAKKYPKDASKYHQLWYKAVNRVLDGKPEGTKVNYGAAINIFRAYATRPKERGGIGPIALEGVDFDALISSYSTAEVNETFRNAPRIKMFVDYTPEN